MTPDRAHDAAVDVQGDVDVDGPGPGDGGFGAGRPAERVGAQGARPERPRTPRRSGGPSRHRAVRERVGGALAVADGAGALAGGAAVRDSLVAGVVVAGCLLLAQHRAGLYRPGFAPGAFAELPGLLRRAALAWGLLALLPGAGGAGWGAGRWGAGPDWRDAGASAWGGGADGWVRLSAAVGVTVAVAGLARAAVYGARRRAARRRPGSTLVVGPDPALAAEIAALLHAHPEYGLRPVGVAAPAAGAPVPVDAEVPGAVPLLAGDPDDVTRAVIQNAVRHGVVVGAGPLDARTTATVRLLAARGCRLWQVDVERRGPSMDGGGHLWGYPCRRLDPYPTVAGRGARGVKRAVDAVGAGVALVCLAPLLAVCALAVRVADGPGVIFRQERIGLGGRPFTLLKFRTLRPANARESATRWSVADDRRMSRAGRLLRRSSLDELPQFWNVLRGDMSLVGPRPERPYFVQQFSQSHAGYADRHRMPAGITGLAQVHGLRGDTSIAERARFDNHYIDSWTLWQDVAILLRTAVALFRCGGS